MYVPVCSSQSPSMEHTPWPLHSFPMGLDKSHKPWGTVEINTDKSLSPSKPTQAGPCAPRGSLRLFSAPLFSPFPLAFPPSFFPFF